LAEDYSRWSTEDLIEEIQREEEALADLRATLQDAEENVAGLEKTIEDERLPLARERYRRRARTIEELRRRIAARTEDIRRRQERIAEREKDLIRLQILRASPITIAAVRRIISALRGWQTRRLAQQRDDQERLARLEALQVKEAALPIRLTWLREQLLFWRDQVRTIRRELAAEEARLERKKAALPKLYRIKIRLYNEIEGPRGSPVGMFQGWFDIDAILDPTTGMVKWEWWLTALEIRIARTHMVGYFKGMAKWASPDDIGQAYLDEMIGIPYGERTATYARTRLGVPLTKGIPSEFIRKAEQMKVADLIVGESSVEPKPNLKPAGENMGVFFQQAMIIAQDGTVKWQERRSRWVWHPPDDQVKKVKEELGIE